MKITKSQLIQVIREELQNERITVGSTPEETAANVAAVHGTGGAFDQRKGDHEIAKEIEGLLLFGKSARHSSAMPDALDKITDLLMKRRGN